jgi:hypothetical protein
MIDLGDGIYIVSQESLDTMQFFMCMGRDGGNN